MIIDLMIEHDSLPDVIRFRETEIGQMFLSRYTLLTYMKLTDTLAGAIRLRGDSLDPSSAIKYFSPILEVYPLSVNFRVTSGEQP